MDNIAPYSVRHERDNASVRRRTHTIQVCAFYRNEKSSTLTDTGAVENEFLEACPTEDDFDVDER